MTSNEVKQLLNESLRMLYDTDESAALSVFRTNERNITAQLLYPLRVNLLSRYDRYQIDHEYGRLKAPEGTPPESKTFSDSSGQMSRGMPDIIIHKRDVRVSEDEDANLLAIEVKLLPSFSGFIGRIGNKRLKERVEKDARKLSQMKAESGKYQYRHTSLLIVTKTEVWASIDADDYEVIFRLPA